MPDRREVYLQKMSAEAAARLRNRKSAISRLKNIAARGDYLKLDSNERLKEIVVRQSQNENWRIKHEDSLCRLPADLDAVPLRAMRRVLDEAGLEQAIGPNDNILSIEFFEQGVSLSSAIGRLEIGLITGTGFLIGENLLLTNHHVIMDREIAEYGKFYLNDEPNRFNESKRLAISRLDPERFFYTDSNLDITIVAVGETDQAEYPISKANTIKLQAGLGKAWNRQPISIIQHPKGRQKSVVVHDSNITFLSDTADGAAFCNYSSDTLPGSSGAPVFNADWYLVAVHHKSIYKQDSKKRPLDKNDDIIPGLANREQIDTDPRVIWESNEGVRVSFIVKSLVRATLTPAMVQIRKRLLASWK